jgi:hypothetical protein
MENTNQKHLTLEDRNYIEQALNHGMTFKKIANFLSKDPTTISKEIKKHRIRKEPNTSLNNATPYDLVQILLDKDVLKKLNLQKVAANEIQLKPKLLKKN